MSEPLVLDQEMNDCWFYNAFEYMGRPLVFAVAVSGKLLVTWSLITCSSIT